MPRQSNLDRLTEALEPFHAEGQKSVSTTKAARLSGLTRVQVVETARQMGEVSHANHNAVYFEPAFQC